MAAGKRKSVRDAGRGLSRSRAARLYHLLKILERGEQAREPLTRRLKVGMRTFYRDLDLLRGWGIHVLLSNHRYRLGVPLKRCLEYLPFPDPELSFAEADMLARGASPANRKLKRLLDAIVRSRR